MDTTTTHELEAGQVLRLVLRRGDRLWLRGGCLLAEPPAAWLGETPLRRQERWPEGLTWTAAEPGTWHCRAVGRTTLVMQRRRRGAGWRAALGGLAAWLAQRFSGPTAPAAQPPAAPRPRPSTAAARCAGTPVR